MTGQYSILLAYLKCSIVCTSSSISLHRSIVALSALNTGELRAGHRHSEEGEEGKMKLAVLFSACALLLAVIVSGWSMLEENVKIKDRIN